MSFAIYDEFCAKCSKAIYSYEFNETYKKQIDKWLSKVNL